MLEDKTIESREKLERLARVAWNKKAEGLTVLDVHALTSYADYFLIASAASNRQVKAIGQAMVEEAKAAGLEVLGVEGLESAKWVLIDLGDIVAHLFFGPVRPFYDLEGLWTDAPRVDVGAMLGVKIDEPRMATAAELADDEEDDAWGDEDALDADFDEDELGEDELDDDAFDA